MTQVKQDWLSRHKQSRTDCQYTSKAGLTVKTQVKQDWLTVNTQVSPLPLRPFQFTAFLRWHPHLSDSNMKEKVPRAACFLPFRPCHLDQTPLLCTSCSNTIPVQNSTKNHTIPLSVWTRLLELLCVFNCSPYFSSCKTPCDLHLCWASRERERKRERERESKNEAPMVWFSAFWYVYFGGM